MSEIQCEHDYVYENKLLSSDPAQQRWICSKCGERGIRVLRCYSSGHKYDALIKRFWGDKAK